jgi:hypothetical protein
MADFDYPKHWPDLLEQILVLLRATNIELVSVALDCLMLMVQKYK